jgi:hypothetical protein
MNLGQTTAVFAVIATLGTIGIFSTTTSLHAQDVQAADVDKSDQCNIGNQDEVFFSPEEDILLLTIMVDI